MDTVRRDALGCYGNPLHPTPGIDALAGEGVRFDRAISSSGWTLPAVTSILTGNWPSIHGALGRNASLSRIRPEMTTAAEVMRTAGFHAVAYANAAFVSPMLGLDRGFDVFDHAYSYNDSIRRADETVDHAIEYVRSHRAESCFMMVHFFDPHLDYDPPVAYRKFTGARTTPPPPLSTEDCVSLHDDATGAEQSANVDYVHNTYLGEVAFVDAQIGRLMEMLKSEGLYDDAMIIVVADHGEEFWDHGGFEHGHTLYDELVRVPLVIKFPGSVKVAARAVDSQVRTIDVMPTVFDCLHVVQPSTFIGESLLGLARGDAHDDRPAFSESLLYGKRRVAWRTGRYTYIQNIEEGIDSVGATFEWATDPGERKNLSETRPDVAVALRQECLSFYFGLLKQAKSMSALEPVDMSPEEVKRLKSLGYIR
jgi:arylsulfatase A-like enzyme